ncbi:MAG: lipopolysaccharide biosynthesis protein, partial [Bacteroidales bacterium]|nr:lipopolysaccharide biosynthesis protein [Bacteroidales bacterium]
RDIGVYALLAAVIFAAMTFVNGRLSMIPALLANTVLIAGVAAFIVRRDFMDVVDKLRHRP